jgi:hypothetical protein
MIQRRRLSSFRAPGRPPYPGVKLQVSELDDLPYYMSKKTAVLFYIAGMTNTSFSVVINVKVNGSEGYSLCRWYKAW